MLWRVNLLTTERRQEGKSNLGREDHVLLGEGREQRVQGGENLKGSAPIGKKRRTG